MEWSRIAEHLDALRPVTGGFTNAQRGILQLDGKDIFVKIGNDPVTAAWARKETHVYETLASLQYEYIPTLLATNPQKTGFAIECLDEANGWQWETPWNHDRLEATLKAMDELARLPASALSQDMMQPDEDDTEVNPWRMPHLDANSREKLHRLLTEAGQSAIIDQLPLLAQSFAFIPKQKALIHYDARRDNCAWNPGLREVKMVDWNWLHVGSREVDVCALLVNVETSGLSIDGFESRLDYGALMWLAGTWFGACVKPGEATMADVEKLRAYQFQSGLTAYDLAQRCKQ